MINDFFDLFFPPLCNHCEGLLTQKKDALCVACYLNLPFTHHYEAETTETFNRFSGRMPLEHAASLLYFHKKGMAQNLIHQLKYKGNQNVGSFLGNLTVEQYKNQPILQNFDEIVMVPLHPKRLKKRGYNQVETFAKTIAEATQKPINNLILYKKIHTETQTKKALSNRTSIDKDTFQIEDAEANIGKHFLLLDDVMTSGTTLETCGKALLQIPKTKISIFTIAYTHF